MKTVRFWLMPVALLAIASSPLPAQRFILFKDGSMIEGKLIGARKDLLASPFGLKKVDPRDVAGQPATSEVARFKAAYEKQAGQMSRGFNRGRVALARWCLDEGYLTGAKAQLEEVLRVDPDFKPALNLIEGLSRTWMFERGESATKGRERRQFIKNLFSKHAAADLTSAMMAASKVSRLPKSETLRAALSGMKHKNPGVRLISARALAAHRDKPERIKPLYRRALVDPAPVVRRECVRSLRVTGDPVFAKLFARNLRNTKQRLRMTAAEALGEFGAEQGIEPLVGALRAIRAGSPSGGVRANITVTTQRAYVKDFDVEIAQGAVIADPVVDIVTEGVVLDVTVVGVSVERGAYTAALRRLSGVDLGQDWRAWESWLKGRQK